MSSVTEILFAVSAWLYPIAFLAAAVMVLVRFRTTTTGLLAGGSFIGFTLRSLGWSLWGIVSEGRSESYAVISIVMAITSCILYVALAAGIFAIPGSLRKLGLRAESQPTTF